MVELSMGGDSTWFKLDRLTTKGVGKRNMTNFIEEILSQAIHKGWPVSAPDSDLRRKDDAKCK